MQKVTSKAIVREAYTWLGTPYHHQASLKGVGCDCLGLILGLWRHFYGELEENIPPYAPTWLEAGRNEYLAEAAGRHLRAIPKTRLKSGDIILLRWHKSYPAKHLGLLTDNRNFIHAYEKAGVCLTPLSHWWLRRIAFCFRFPDIEA